MNRTQKGIAALAAAALLAIGATGVVAFATSADDHDNGMMGNGGMMGTGGMMGMANMDVAAMQAHMDQVLGPGSYQRMMDAMGAGGRAP